MNPTWTGNPVGNAIPTQTIGASNSTAAWIDFRGVMRGRIVARATPIGGISTAGNPFQQIYLFLGSMATGAPDTQPVFSSVLQSGAVGAVFQLSYELDSGYYYAVLVNNDSAYSASVSLTTETLSWPS